MGEINIKVNGKNLSCDSTDSLLNICLKNGVYIPHLCSHPQLEVSGGCGLCVVAIEGESDCVRACTVHPHEGMSVSTETDEVHRLRRLAMELILSEHPEDCSSCPVFGKCMLQSVIQYVGASNGRFRSLEKHSACKENSLFVHDMYRCIKCGRCVRVCRDVRGVGVMKYLRDEQGDVVVGFDGEQLRNTDCRFCGACVEVCPTGALRDAKQAISEASSRDAALIPCAAKCPAHVDIPRYIRYIKDGRYQEALNTIRENVAFPASLGYICRNFCEEACRRRLLTDAVSIRELKKFAALNDDGSWKKQQIKSESTGKRIAVIGGGPAGLTAAQDLALRGNAVTVFEKSPEAGGMLRYGIPEYRLPTDVVRREVADIAAAGVNIICSATADAPEELLRNGYDAVIVTVGTGKGSVPSIEGSDLTGVYCSIDFLRAVRSGELKSAGDNVVVVGGGNVAFDCARTAVRLGAKTVKILARKPEDKLRCDEEELREAKAEGVLIIAPRDFLAISGAERATGVITATLIKTQSEGCEKYVRDADAQPIIEQADTVIFAIGQKPDSLGLECTASGMIMTDGCFKTSQEGVFAAGDAVTGTKSVIEAIAAGHRAADAVTGYLGLPCVPTVMAGASNHLPDIGACPGFAQLRREKPDVQSLNSSCQGFAQIHLPFNAERARQEAGRCLQCDLRTDIELERLWTEYKKDGAENNADT